MMSFSSLRLGNKSNRGGTTIARDNHLRAPKRWEILLDEHDQCMQEVEESLQVWLDRHRETIKESNQWKEANEKLTRELQDTRVELASTKRRMHVLQQQVIMSSTTPPSTRSSRNKHGNETRLPTALPHVLGNSETRDNYSSERNASNSPEGVARNRGQQLLHELASNNMEESSSPSYQVILRWQERQTDQWKSRCHRQLNQIDGLLAKIERQRNELNDEKEQCDLLIDAVYHLIQQEEEVKEDEDEIAVAAAAAGGGGGSDDNDDENNAVEDSTNIDASFVSADPDDCCFCPLTQQLFVDPVIDYEGNTYERKAILEWLEFNETSPLTRNHLTKDQLIPNRAVKHAIAAWDNKK
ncbi:unnamed protein product [Cylindrotheca closterium]|uniref:U-box domain-containing protein n=1 Tax=Cylindrotheca closterium TaxID=2856 RepID=A0AAD2FUI3_9STRA|nr:unnamed protein product [Cylindrotheca closterium]